MKLNGIFCFGILTLCHPKIGWREKHRFGSGRRLLFLKMMLFSHCSCMIAEPQTVVIETEAEIEVLERDVNLWKRYMWIYLHRAELWLHWEDLSNEICSSIFFPGFLYEDFCISPNSWYIRVDFFNLILCSGILHYSLKLLGLFWEGFLKLFSNFSELEYPLITASPFLSVLFSVLFQFLLSVIRTVFCSTEAEK